MRTCLWFILLIVIISCHSSGQSPFYKARINMVKYQIQNRGISDTSVLAAMRIVPRHRFVPFKLSDHAYDDNALPIGKDQTISQPYIVAYMTAKLNLKHDSRVLEIGTGSGYQAAVLSRIVDSVFTIEIIKELSERASQTLKNLGYLNVICKQGDGYKGWKEKGPFDAIIVTAAAEDIPVTLENELKPGGRMIIPVGSQESIQYLILVIRKNGGFEEKRLIPVRFVPFIRE